MAQTAGYDVHIPALDVYFPTPWRHKSDADIESIARILELNGRGSWSASPRLFCILHMIGHVERMDELLDEGVNDFDLPLPPRTHFRLPPQFRKAQQYILTRKFTGATKWPYRGHMHFSGDDSLPFKPERRLGHGLSGIVEKVYDPAAQRFLARKLVLRRHTSRKRGSAAQNLKEEIKINRRLSHRHCVEFAGSYTTPRYIAILVTPVADCDLETFLDANSAHLHNSLLESWFGCLASALLYLHNNNIRHADIKPRNVLVAGTTILLTDFGISSDWTGKPPGNLENEDPGFTRTYASHEMLILQDCDGSSDVWSLGCVFLELLTALTGKTSKSAQHHLHDKIIERGRLASEIGLIPDCIQSLSFGRSGLPEREVKELVLIMLSTNRRNRPTANQVASKLREITNYAPQWCGACCIRTLSDDQEAREGLHHFVGSQKKFSEEDVQYIRRKLAFEQMEEWSSIPRTYIILTLIDRLDLIPVFLRAGVSDIWFPYDRQLLRQVVKEPKVIQDFLDNQDAVLSPKLLENEHQHFIDGNDHLQDIKELGSGGFGSVWHSFDPEKNRHVAKKLIPRVKVVVQHRAKDAADTYEKELAVLRRVSAEEHRHLIQMVGSYTDLSDFVILFSPVADMNLGTYMDDPQSEENLRRWFGCLATALQYLHSMRIRHKDIKPQNALVVGNNIMLTDFGISYDWSDNSRPTTSGPGARDPRYCAPEVADWETRNESADVWSLGCIFLEMHSILLGYKIADIRLHFGSCGTRTTWYHKNEAALKSWFQTLSESTAARQSVDAIPLEWIIQMVNIDKDARICCDDLVKSILDPHPDDMRDVGRYCGKCCIDAYHEKGIFEDDDDDDDDE